MYVRVFVCVYFVFTDHTVWYEEQEWMILAKIKCTAAAAAAEVRRGRRRRPQYCWVVLCCGQCVRRWFCSPNWEAQVLPQWGHCGPVFGFVAAVWRATRHSSEAASQSLTKCAGQSLQVTRLNEALAQVHFDVVNESLLRVADWSLVNRWNVWYPGHISSWLLLFYSFWALYKKEILRPWKRCKKLLKCYRLWRICGHIQE